MTEQGNSSWEDVVDRLRRAASDLKSAAGQAGAPNEDEEAAATRLKHDVSRLEQSAADLRSKLTVGMDSQRKEFESALDRERAEQAAGQVRVALDELAGLAKAVTLDLKAAATASMTHAQPELKTAVRTLEDVAASAGSWVRAVIDPDRKPTDRRYDDAKPPLDDF